MEIAKWCLFVVGFIFLTTGAVGWWLKAELDFESKLANKIWVGVAELLIKTGTALIFSALFIALVQ